MFYYVLMRVMSIFKKSNIFCLVYWWRTRAVHSVVALVRCALLCVESLPICCFYLFSSPKVHKNLISCLSRTFRWSSGPLSVPKSICSLFLSTMLGLDDVNGKVPAEDITSLAQARFANELSGFFITVMLIYAGKFFCNLTILVGTLTNP